MTDTIAPIDTPHGRLQGARTGDVLHFMGIPYAAPPVGPLRLRSPRPAAGWAGVRDATRPGAASLQTLAGQQTWMNEPIDPQDEDCLFLNVWTPGTHGRHPVLLWLHGGQTRNGHGAAPGIDGAALARRGLVVVTINYRLGALGGLAHPDLEDSATGLCANWGLQDKLAALAWVRDAIAAFGGDPARVTLAGQSSGAANAVMIAQHGLAAGQYARVIAQSPPLFRPPMFVDLAAASAYTEALAERLGTTVRGLREVDGRGLQQAEQAYAASPELAARMGRPRTAPVLDGRLLRHWPHDGPPIGLPLLASWTRHEADFWFDLRDGDGRMLSPQQAPRTADELQRRLAGLIAQHHAFDPSPAPLEVLAWYADAGPPAQVWRQAYTDLVFRAPIVRLLRGQAGAGHAAWAAEFAYPLPNETQGSPHASDVPFVFGTWGHPHLACKLGASPAVAELSDAVMARWIRFAQDGTPGDGWPAFDPAQPQVMRFGPGHAQVVPLERAEQLAAWPGLREAA